MDLNTRTASLNLKVFSRCNLEFEHLSKSNLVVGWNKLNKAQTALLKQSGALSLKNPNKIFKPCLTQLNV